jgi:hypothetical protein
MAAAAAATIATTAGEAAMLASATTVGAGRQAGAAAARSNKVRAWRSAVLVPMLCMTFTTLAMSPNSTLGRVILNKAKCGYMNAIFARLGVLAVVVSCLHVPATSSLYQVALAHVVA